LDKAPDAFRTISEVAEEINVPQHVLRFWESRFAQIRPMKRGGGRRYYRPDDVDLLRGVRHLLYGTGYTIRGVQRILREEGVAFVQSVWQVGSEAPPPEADEDGEGDDDTQNAARRSQERLLRVLSTLTSGDATEPPPHVAGEERRKLQTVLDDLIECRRLIEAAFSENYGDDSGARAGDI
jgi:DNA-binding transcriptional MerR regulator